MNHRTRAFASLFALAVASALAASETVTQGDKVMLSTPASTQRIRQEFERQMLGLGYLLQSSQEGILVYEGDSDAATAFMWANSYTGEKPKFRYRVNIVDLSDSRRVVISKSVFIPGTKLRSAHEEARSRSADMDEIRGVLSKVAAGLESR